MQHINICDITQVSYFQSTMPSSVHDSDDHSEDSSYEIRKRPHDRFVKGVPTKNGKTVRAKLNGAMYYNYAENWGKDVCKTMCEICNVHCCDHTVMNHRQHRYKYTTDSRLQCKNVRKCDSCTTHICEECIPIRGRKIKIDMNDLNE